MKPLQTDSLSPSSFPAGFWRRHGRKLAALAMWLTLLGSYIWYVRTNDLTLADAIRRLANLLTQTAYGPLLYILIYLMRPLIFFPSTGLTVLSGFLFGPIGILFTVIGANSSAMVAYGIGRYFGRGVLETADSMTIIQQFAQRLRENSFETVLIMHLIFLPYDLVNYITGFLRINWKAFLLGTALGSLPGTTSFNLLGSSFGTVEDLLAGELKLNPLALGVSIALVSGSIALSQYLKRRVQP